MRFLFAVLVAAASAIFSPPDLKHPDDGFDNSSAKPASMSWREWCALPAEGPLGAGLINRSIGLMRDTPWLQRRAATLDALEFVAPKYAPELWQHGTRLLDVGAASGELTRFFARKYGLKATALDVSPPRNNSFAKYSGQRVDAWPVTVFDGVQLPAADGQYDVVLFVVSLHHAAIRAPALLREARRVSRSTIVVVEAVDVLGEAKTAEELKVASDLRAREFACMGDKNAIFRSQSEWQQLLEEDRDWRVTHIGAVLDKNDNDAAEPGTTASDSSSADTQLSVHNHLRFFVVHHK